MLKAQKMLFSANFVQNVSKNVKNTVFSHFLRKVNEKDKKTSYFEIFANFVQSVTKNFEIHCFLTLFEE